MSNFLGDAYEVPPQATSILSTNELLAREGVNVQKGMNFRKDPLMLPVFLVLPSHEGEYKEVWDAKKEVYTFEGHDSTTVETGGKSKDQLLMYSDGKLSENGKFYKAANEYKDGVRKAPLKIQVYEKLDPGVWFDKDVFNLVDARRVTEEGRVLFKFDLQPADAERANRDAKQYAERMLPVTTKVAVWKQDNGRCVECGSQAGLRFAHKTNRSALHLLCATHRGEDCGLLGF
jgi:hypothetical protein